MIKLTLEQCTFLELAEEAPPRVLDPITHRGCVLLRHDLYQRAKRQFDADEDSFATDMAPLAMEVLGRNGWDDPDMDVYNDLDPRINR